MIAQGVQHLCLGVPFAPLLIKGNEKYGATAEAGNHLRKVALVCGLSISQLGL